MMNQDDRQPLQIDHIDWLIDSPSNRAEFDSKQNTASKQDRKVNRWVGVCVARYPGRDSSVLTRQKTTLLDMQTHATHFSEFSLTDTVRDFLLMLLVMAQRNRWIDEMHTYALHTSIGSGTYWNEWKYIYEQGSCSHSQSEKYEPPIIREREKKRRRHITLCTLSIIWVRVI